MAIFRNKWHFFFGHFQPKMDKNWQKRDDFQQKRTKSCQNLLEVPYIFPEKKCHLFWKIATFLTNFDPHFTEKYIFRV